MNVLLRKFGKCDMMCWSVYGVNEVDESARKYAARSDDFGEEMQLSYKGL